MTEVRTLVPELTTATSGTFYINGTEVSCQPVMVADQIDYDMTNVTQAKIIYLENELALLKAELNRIRVVVAHHGDQLHELELESLMK